MREPISLLATGLDVSELVAWIEAIPLTAWPAGDLTRLRPAMVTDPKWHGLHERTSAIVRHLLGAAVDRFGHDFADKSRWLSVVMPGDSIDPHSDAAEPGWFRRVHVPLVTNDRASFVVEGEPHHLDFGSAYLFDKTSRHEVVNRGETPRIHFMFELMRKA